MHRECYATIRSAQWGQGKVYKTVVRPAMMYGAEDWSIKKAQKKKLELAEMQMLRWMCGATRLDRIRNERIRGTTKVVEISKMRREDDYIGKRVLDMEVEGRRKRGRPGRRLQWYGHVMRREDDYIGKRVLDMEVEGRRKTKEKMEGLRGWRY
ncbi:uncharacterized protein LOC106473195 [Limulus polyphemus]|uniref:Uncharacterized protein LOC106473195 n=1 Tax=Limulus polyphemus TaxID=6850 RepID=A0ABM1BV90_LIMPO|nr:uncharacterized protein LOC106473195 [Limulus polyphemus]